MKEITKLLNSIQKELSVPKNQRNNFGNYSYRSAEDILDAVKKMLGEAVVVVNDDIVMIGDRYYVKATATLKLADDEISTTAFAREAENKKGMDSAQVTGATSSYARKYALNGLFAIDDTKDADTMDNSKPSPKPEPMITKVQETEIDKLVKSRGRTISEVCKTGKIKTLKELTKTRADNLITHLGEKKVKPTTPEGAKYEETIQ